MISTKSKKVAIISLDGIKAIVIACILSLGIAFAVTTSRMDGHVAEVRIHKGVEELTVDFMPRESLEIQIQALRDQINRLELILDEIEKQGVD